ncbi:CHAT domain-containing protein [Streptomyces sp. NBC_00825]|uniref:CHAT domain-containing protein n=1 Tax=unclassified Streptomyces TaxID=2593676 RepID=UPI002ED246CA|nr:CHAT domain-containing protein [Streptomyces sp. NBC_00826]WTH93947.1 CHAT domain-containing protein [Streptomyces sp. NBC_00825]WTI02682.1 CHAT domain-containing protein [Streptomyces sp. NBC_00822]
MRDDARGRWVDEVAGLARRWLGPGVLPEGPRPDEWWAALAARTAQAALAAHEGSADVARALAAAVGLGLDTGTESLPVSRHPTAVRSGEPVLVRRVAQDAGPSGYAWSPPPGDRDPAFRWPRPPVTPARYLEGREGPPEELSAAELGRRLLTDHLRTGAPEQLDEAEAVLRSVVREVPSDGVHQESAYGDLAWALLLRFIRSEQREDLDGAIEYAMVARVFDQPAEPGAAHPPPWEAVLGMALLARHDLTGRGVDLDNAVAALERSAARLHSDDPDLDTVLSTLADALLCRHGQRGNPADLRRAGELQYNVEHYPSLATARFAAYLSSGGPEALDDAVDAGTASVDQARDPAQRAWSLNNLAGYLLARHEASRDPADAAAAVVRLNSARELLRRGTTAYAAVSLNLARALMAGPTPLRTRAARLAGEALDTEHTTLALQAQALELLCAVAEFDGGRSPVVEVRAEILDLRLGALVERLNAEPAGPRVSSLRWARARLRRGMGRHEESRELAREVLADRVWDVLAQPDPAEAYRWARRTLGEAAEMAAWLSADERPGEAFAAVESARDLALHAATDTDPVADRLAAIGSDDLRRRWLLARESTVLSSGPAAPHRELDGPPAGQDRQRLLAEVRQALSPRSRIGPAPAAGLLERPSLRALAEQVRAVDADAVVHLVLGRGATPGRALVLHAAGDATALPLPNLCESSVELRRFVLAHDRCLRFPEDKRADNEWGKALRGVYGWSWQAVVGPLLSHLSARPELAERMVPQVVLVPTGTLGLVPWHAARRKGDGPGRHYAIEDAGFSYAPSAGSLGGFADRAQTPLNGAGLVVADPSDDLPHARQEGGDLHRWYYAKGPRLGRSGDPVAPPATPRTVLGSLLADTASGAPPVAHFACHARSCAPAADSHLVLAGGQRLTVAALLRSVRPTGRPDGPLVVLSGCATAVPGDRYDESLSLATAFASAGAAAVVGTLWAVRDEDAAQLMTDFHHFLNLDGLPAAEALRQAQLRALARARRRTAGGSAAARTRAEDPLHWGAFLHYGRGVPGALGPHPGPEAEAGCAAGRNGGRTARTRSPIFARMPGGERSEVVWLCPEADCPYQAEGDAKAPFDEDTCPRHPRQALRRE